MSGFERTRTIVERVGGLLAGLTALGAAFFLSKDKLEAFLKPLAPQLAPYGAWLLVVALAAILVVLALRASPSASKLIRPEYFDLRIRLRKQLKGRDDDIRDVVALVSAYPLTFLSGESGSGKSTLLVAGVLPALAETGRLLPIMVSKYGLDWDTGPQKETAQAIWEALSNDERVALGWARRPDPSSVSIETLTTVLSKIVKELGRTPLLVFDQFDDYQLQHRKEFTGASRAWLTHTQLEAQNSFWRCIADLSRRETIHVLIVTRIDTTSGLGSASFVDEPQSRELHRLESQYLAALLDDITADAPEGVEVISNPDEGWRQLKVALVPDLESNGTVLPQQLRIVLLGLRHLKALTVKEYRRVGSAAGVEVSYVRRAIEEAAQHNAVKAASVRALLLALIDEGERNLERKTVARTSAQLEGIIPDAAVRQKVLEELEQSEIVRSRVIAESEEPKWQLDHDYLARAVLLEERAQNPVGIAVRECATRWRHEKHSLSKRLWSELLPVPLQLKALRARLSMRNPFIYGGDRGYAALSGVRFAPSLVVLIAAIIAGKFYLVDREAKSIAYALQSESSRFGVSPGTIAIAELWVADAAVRRRVFDIVSGDCARLARAGEHWIDAVIGLDPQEAQRAADRLLERLVVILDSGETKGDCTSDDAGSVANLYVRVMFRIRPADAESLVTALLATMKPTYREDARSVLTTTLSAIAHRVVEHVSDSTANSMLAAASFSDLRLSPNLIQHGAGKLSVETANQTANAAVAGLNSAVLFINSDPMLRYLAAVAPRVDAAAAERLLRNLQDDPFSRAKFTSLDTFGHAADELAKRVPETEAKLLFQELLAKATAAETSGSQAALSLSTAAAISARLDDKSRLALNESITKASNAFPGASSDASNFYYRVSEVILVSFSEANLAQHAQSLIEFCIAKNDREECTDASAAIIRLLQHIGATHRPKLIKQMLASMGKISAAARMPLKRAFVTAVSDMSAADADAIANEILERLARKEGNATAEWLYQAFPPIGKQMSEAEATKLAEKLFTLLKDPLQKEAHSEQWDSLVVLQSVSGAPSGLGEWLASGHALGSYSHDETRAERIAEVNEVLSAENVKTLLTRIGKEFADAKERDAQLVAWIPALVGVNDAGTRGELLSIIEAKMKVTDEDELDSDLLDAIAAIAPHLNEADAARLGNLILIKYGRIPGGIRSFNLTALAMLVPRVSQQIVLEWLHTISAEMLAEPSGLAESGVLLATQAACARVSRLAASRATGVHCLIMLANAPGAEREDFASSAWTELEAINQQKYEESLATLVSTNAAASKLIEDREMWPQNLVRNLAALK